MTMRFLDFGDKIPLEQITEGFGFGFFELLKTANYEVDSLNIQVAADGS
jgi:hypothetical protein